MTVNEAESLNHKERIKDLLQRLRNKLQGFAIINMQGQLIGRVKNLTLDKNRHLYLIMSREEAQAGSPSFLVSSKYIQKVDSANRLLFVDLTQKEVDSLPVYPFQNTDAVEMLQYSPTQSVAQANNTDAKFRETLAAHDQSLPVEPLREGNNESFGESDEESEIVEEEIIRLLEERLVINRSKRKVGEVIVRKEIETQIVEVPIQREKLIIEQVGSETKQLAEIDLGKGEVTGVELANVRSSESFHRDNDRYTVSGEFLSPKAASDLLDAIAHQKQHGCEKVRIELVVDNPEVQATYQTMFDRCSNR
ncbi:MAG TPA: DUF2382 domain-containing protein [Coleofasciculaceae cyanobacterium]